MSELSPAEAAEAREALRRFVEGWNGHDPAAMAAAFTKDGDVVTPFGRFAAGRRQIEQLLRDEHAFHMAQSTLRFKRETVRRVSSEVVLIDTEGVIECVAAPGGGVFDLQHSLAIVLVRAADEDMRISAIRAILRPK